MGGEVTAARALEQILAAAGLPAADAARATLRGADPVFPLAPRAGEGGAAAIAACGLAAAALWETRGGRRQSVTVDVRRAAAAMRSHQYLRVERDGADVSDEVARGPDVTGIYPARDGRWIYLHCTFPHHQHHTLGVLDAPADRAAVAAAVARRDGEPLEEAVVAAGACAGVVRSAAEWAAHAQGRAVAALPLLEVARIGDAPAEPLPPPPAGDPGPLSAVRVLDLTRVLAGPTCARTLAEHGADVLRIGATGLPSPLYQTLDTGHGKRSAALDLATAGGAQTLLALSREADVFSQSYRPGSLAARGFSEERLAALRPGIVYVTLSAFGHEGPWAARRGFDTLVQCVGGLAGEHALDGRPRLLPVSALDYITGYLAAFGAMVALRRRARSGGSYRVRVSLAQTAHWLRGLGDAPGPAVAAAAEELTPAEIEAATTWTESPVGRLRHLSPVAQLSETPAHWRRPAVPLDHDRPEWLPRPA